MQPSQTTDLSKKLLEVGEKQRGEVRETGQRSIISHRAEGLLPESKEVALAFLTLLRSLQCFIIIFATMLH